MKKKIVLQPCNCIAREKGAEIWNGLLPNCIARKALYCDIVALDVQYGRNGIAREWCAVTGSVLQHNGCIVT